MENQTNLPQPTMPTGEPAKKPYSPPEILFIAPLEATADVCDPLAGGKAGGTCIQAQS